MLRKYILLSVVILIVFSAPALANASITLNNLSSSTIKASDDYATDTFLDSWDMSNSEDVWPVYSNVSGASFANGIFSATTTSTDPQIYFLWGGYPNSIDLGRDGKNRPIDARTYSKVAIKMYSSSSGTAQMYWFYEQDTGINYARESFAVSAGWHIYILNNESTFNGNWTDKPISLRIDPVNVAGANFMIDWVHVGKASDALINLSWSDTGSGGNFYEAYIDDDQSGYDGESLGTAVISARSANLNLQSIAPGNYYLYLRKDNNPNSSEYSNHIPVTINAPPTVKITDPDVAGGKDWATEVLGDPWDMSNSSDVSGTRNISGRRFSNGVYTALNTNNDPIIYLNFHRRKIDTSRYHQLTVKYKFDDTFNLVRGTMARVGWSKTFSRGWQMTDDILTYEGWNIFSFNLKDASLDVGNYGWRSQMSYFRFDPHEDPQRRRFYIDYVKIAADDELTNKAFNIKYTVTDSDNASVNLTLKADKDKIAANGNEQTIYSGVVGRGDGSYRWVPGSGFNGDYYIQSTVSDGIKSTISYSSGILHVDTYRPKTYGRRVGARRMSKKRAPRYLRLYKAYKAKYKKARSRTLRRRYLRAARRYYRAYRKALKQIAIANIRFFVKDPYVDKAYTKLRIQKRVKSRWRNKRKARYFRLYRAYKAKYKKMRNRTLRRHYLRVAKKYYKAYRKTKTIVYKTVKVVNYRWTSINRWRTYKYRTSKAGIYRYLVYARDRASNTEQQVRNGILVVR